MRIGKNTVCPIDIGPTSRPNISVLMSFDGPDRILPICHHLMSFDGPKHLMSFDAPKPRFSPVKISCLLMDPICTYIFKVFPSKTSCLLMDPFLDSNLVSFDGPKPHVF